VTEKSATAVLRARADAVSPSISKMQLMSDIFRCFLCCLAHEQPQKRQADRYQERARPDLNQKESKNLQG
jgi:hypothetical protein